MTELNDLKIKNFLQAITSRVRKGTLREEVLQELSGHIQETVDAFIEKGFTEDAAVAEALKRLGDPLELGKKLSVANRPWFLRWFFLVPSSVSALSLIGVVALHSLAEDRIEAIADSYHKEESVFNQFLQDQELLQKYDFLSPPGHSRDAGKFLNARVEWSGSYVPEKYRKPSIHISEEQSKILQDLFKQKFDRATKLWGPKWYELSDRELFRKIDLSWMKKLDRYDHWDLFASEGPALENLKQGLVPYVISAPNYSPFFHYARLRYLRALYERNPLPALREIRKLALLIHSNENLISAMIAYGLLGIEREFYEVAVQRKLLRSGDWQVLTKDDQWIAKRATYATGEWVSLFTPKKMTKEILEEQKPIVGICAGLYESIVQISLLRPYFQPRTWGEMDFQKNYDMVQEIIKTKGSACRLTAAQQFLQTRYELEPDLLRVAGEKTIWETITTPFMIHAQHIPYLRRYVGLSYEEVARPSFISPYHRNPASQ